MPGEGSRGGNVIGHTRSGKPIYRPAKGPRPPENNHYPYFHEDAASHVNEQEDYSWKDHLDAHGVHMAEAKKQRAAGNEEQAYWHGAIAGAHRTKKERMRMSPAPASTKVMNSLSVSKSDNSTPEHTTDWKKLPSEFMADVAKCYDTMKKAKKSEDAPGDSDGDAIDMEVRETASSSMAKNHHGPIGGGGVAGTFGGNAGAGFQQGAALGTAVGSEVASGTPGAPHALGHAALGKVGQAMSPMPSGSGGGSQGSQGSKGSGSPNKQGGSSSGGSSGGGGGVGAGMGVGATSKSCAACKAGSCDDKGHEMEKALTSRSLSIPFYMRGPAYDPNDTMRSATTQTSRMYTAIAPDVANTLQTVMESETVRTQRAAEDLKRSQEIAELRNRMVANVRPRGDTRFGG